MNILYVAPKYDYGDPARGHSFEHYNFFDSLHNMGHNILYFDFPTLLREHGRAAMNRRLLEVVTLDLPDLMFTVLAKDELDEGTVQQISDACKTATLNWFCDDHWRFENFSSRWAPRFNWVVTTANNALPKYQLLGYNNAIKSQWACNQFLYRRLDLAPRYDATFVGLPHGDRRYVVQALTDGGVNLQVWGKGWPNGRISQTEMIRVFNQSRVNLNLANSVSAQTTRARVAGLLLRNLMQVPLSAPIRAWFVRCIVQLEGRGDETTTSRYTEQIKARNFEIPGCGGFVLTGWADGLEEYYLPDQEISSYARLDELVRRVRYFLAHDDERAAIAEAGFKRTLSSHTYVHRFAAIFERMGLLSGSGTAESYPVLSSGSLDEVR